MSKGGAGQVQETEQQRALAEHAQNLMQDYRQRWEPVQMHLAGGIKNLGQPGSVAQKLVEGRSASDVNQAFSQAQGGLEKSLTNAGVAPGSSRANLAVAGGGLDQARSRGLGTTIADQQITDAYTEGLGSLMALGRGQRAQVGSALGKQAAFSGAQAQADAQASLMNAQGNAQMLGQVAGLGLQGAMGAMGRQQQQQPYSRMASPDIGGTSGGFGWKGGIGGM
jgi:hypothetical protein